MKKTCFALFWGCAVLKTMAADTLALTAVEKQFEDRGLLAESRLDKLTPKFKSMGEDGFTSKEGRLLLWQIAIESAYSAHFGVKDAVQTPSKDDFGNEGRAFHIILSSDGKLKLDSLNFFDIVYRYSSNGKLVATTVTALPRNWKIEFMPVDISGTGRRVLRDSLLVWTEWNDLLVFELSDPFGAAVRRGGTKPGTPSPESSATLK